MSTPPFCPNPHCPHHYQDCVQSRHRWFCRDGTFESRREGETQRYRCQNCGKRFSTATFSTDYYAKRRISLPRLRRMLVSGSSVRAASRQLFCSPSAVSRRLIILARQSLACHQALSPCLTKHEALVADGFQSFWVSQYHPNNFNLLCGSESQYVYALTSVSLKRSGRMSAAQLRRRAQIERSHPSDPAALERSFAELVAEALRVWRRQSHPQSGTAPGGTLITDEHHTYPRSILPLRAQTQITHLQVSSRRARTRENPLFPVNYLDREIRKDLAEHHRETVCFARNAAHSVARMWVYLVWHNTEKPYRICPRFAGTHAEVAHATSTDVRRVRARLYRRRQFLSHCTALSEAQRRDWLQLHWTPERENRRNLRVTPAYAAL
ncbi:MAG: transposase [Spirochaetota bacterium]